MIFHFQCILLIIESSYKKKAQKQCRQAKPNFEQKPQSYLFVLLFAFWLPLHLVCFFGLKFFRCLVNCIPVVCFVTISRFSWAWKHSTCKDMICMIRTVWRWESGRNCSSAFGGMLKAVRIRNISLVLFVHSKYKIPFCTRRKSKKFVSKMERIWYSQPYQLGEFQNKQYKKNTNSPPH